MGGDGWEERAGSPCYSVGQVGDKKYPYSVFPFEVL